MSEFELVRSTVVAAEPARVHGLIDDFHEWRAWSPWEDLDPDLQRTYSGPDSGVGAHYAWQGNRRAGSGSMEITGSTPEQIDVRLSFLKPFSATNQVRFTLTPTSLDAPAGSTEGTTVEWRMRGEQKGLSGLIGRLIPMERMVGKDFEKGLTRLKAVAEG